MKNSLKKELLTLAQKYGVKLRFVARGDFAGKYDCDNKIIIINFRANVTRGESLSVFFHELGHWYCCRNNLWRDYHYPSNKIDYNQIIKTALKAERFIDRWAKKEMSNYCDLQFEGLYISKDSFYRNYAADYLRKYLLNYFKQKH